MREPLNNNDSRGFHHAQLIVYLDESDDALVKVLTSVAPSTRLTTYDDYIYDESIKVALICAYVDIKTIIIIQVSQVKS